MLSVRQIKKMTRAATDKTIASEGNLRGNENFWTNGFLGFWEPAPEGLLAPDHEKSESNARAFAAMEKIVAEATTPCTPTEIQGFYGDVTIRMVTDNGANVWLNARYISAMLKRGATAFALAPATRCVTCRSEKREIGLVMALREPPCDFEWRLVNSE